MKLLRAVPVLILACGGLSLMGCQGFNFGKRPVPGKDGEVLDKLEVTQSSNERLPEIVSLPAPATPALAPVAPAPAPVVATPQFAASKPATTVRSMPDPFMDDTVAPSRRGHGSSRGHIASAPGGGGSGPKSGVHAAPGPHAKTYAVQRGDTLQKISQKFYGTTKNWTKIYEANKVKLKKPDVIVVGTVLTIP